MPQRPLFRLIPMSRARLAVATTAFLAFVVGISWLGVEVIDQIKKESESRSDNAQWALSQIEVELHYLMSATDSVLHGTAPLNTVRLRYDILYSRMETLRIGRVFVGLRESSQYVGSIEQLDAFMLDQLPFIDGSDAALNAHLPALHSNANALIDEARIVALTGIKVIAEVSDRRRAEVAKTLTLAGGLTVFLVSFLVALVVLLLRLFRFNRMRSAENLATLSRLHAVVSTAMEALVTVDAKGRIVDFNDAARQTFGYSRAEAVGADMAELVAADPEGQSLFRRGAGPDIEGQGRFRIMARHKDGRIIPAEVSISRMTSGNDTLFVAFLRDLSIQLAAEQALVAARDEARAGEKAKADLLVVMSHEIRTPLNGMIGTIELLDSSDLQPHQREYLRIMDASSKLLMHHVNDVLDIARLDSGKAALLSGPVDLAAIVQEVIENQLPASLANGNAMVFVAPPDGRTMVDCDGAQLRQVLLNLVGNAVKFTRNGQISVELEHLGPGGPTEIRVKDTGVGIPQGDMERIFDDFVTLDASYARRSSGTGLGLGIVKRIVLQMGGTVSADSQKSHGSTFRVRLPLKILELKAQALPEMTATRTESAGAQSMVTLVVEDNEFNRLIVHEMLTKLGHEVVEARDGEEGVALAAERRFDLILMDISMPRVDGLQAAQTILTGQGASRQTPIVAMTAHAMAAETAKFRAGGMKEVLVKPITREALKAVLQAATYGSGQTWNSSQRGLMLDRKALDALSVDLGRSKASKLVLKFRMEAAATVARVAAALTHAAPDKAMIHDLHRLQGSAGLFGACGLQSVLSDIETAWKTGAQDEAGNILARLTGVWEATEAEFQDEPDFAQPSNLR